MNLVERSVSNYVIGAESVPALKVCVESQFQPAQTKISVGPDVCVECLFVKEEGGEEGERERERARKVRLSQIQPCGCDNFFFGQDCGS